MLLVSIVNNKNFSDSFPIFIEFKDEIQTLVLISDDMDVIINYRMFITLNKLNINLKFYIKNIENKINLIESVLNDLNLLCENSEKVYFNTTDNDTIYTILLGNVILKNNGSILHYNINNTIDILYKENYETITIRNNASILEHLSLRGINVLDYNKHNNIEERKKILYDLFLNKKTIKNFISFKNNFKTNDNTFDYIKNQLTKINMLKEEYIKGVIFEEYIYLLLSDLNIFDEIKLSVKINKNDVDNEIDILAIKDNKIYNIECKFRFNFESSSYIYKSDSMHNILDDDGSSIIISLTNSPNFSDASYQRGKLSNVYILESDFINKENLYNFIYKIINKKNI